MTQRTLPKINLSTRTSSNSPFHYPTDEEIFLYNDSNYKKSISFHKQKQLGLNSRSNLRRFEKILTPYDDDYSKKNPIFNLKEQKEITEAMKIIQQRKKEKEELDKEGFIQSSHVKTIEEKRQLFLISSAYNNIEIQIEKLKEQSKEKQDAITQSLKMLDQDADNFKKFLDFNKQSRVDVQLKVDNEIKERKIKEGIIKQLNIKITSLRGEKTRMEELINTYMDHKSFLDNLAPKEYRDLKIQYQQQKVDNLRELIINSRNQEFRMSEEAKLFNDELEDFEYEYDMYFKDPTHLIQVFNDLEERNLFLIQTNQDIQQNLEEVKSKFSIIQNEKETKVLQLIEQKEILKRKLDQMNTEMKNFQMNWFTKPKEQKDLGQQVIEVYYQFQSEIGIIQDVQNRPTIFILSLIEKQVDKLLKEVKTFKPERIIHFKQEIDNKNKADKRKENSDRQREEEATRNRINQIKLMQPSKKKIGRFDMFRSKPFDRKEVISKEQVEEVDTEDNQYFE